MRPPFYTNPEELNSKIEEYFKSGHKTRPVILKDGTAIDVPIITITGLVRYCGFESRQSFYAYEDKPEFSYTIKSARNRIEEEYEELLQRGLGAGAIFALKNFGWKDVVEHKGDGLAQRNETHIHYPDGWRPKEERKIASETQTIPSRLPL